MQANEIKITAKGYSQKNIFGLGNGDYFFKAMNRKCDSNFRIIYENQ